MCEPLDIDRCSITSRSHPEAPDNVSFILISFRQQRCLGCPTSVLVVYCPNPKRVSAFFQSLPCFKGNTSVRGCVFTISGPAYLIITYPQVIPPLNMSSSSNSSDRPCCCHVLTSSSTFPVALFLTPSSRYIFGDRFLHERHHILIVYAMPH